MPGASASYHGRMTNDDAAFLWESSALRERRGRQTQPSIPFEPGWVTLRDAQRATGVPIDTLRKWGRQGSVPSMVVQTDSGSRRLVRLESVVRRAQHQGRPIPSSAAHQGTDPVSSGSVEGSASETTHRSPDRGAAAESATVAEGNMIVPIEAWDRMLMQLGNLHEAGQQLAEARERAARAETEAAFLRERLAELRTPPPAPDDVAEPVAPPAPSPRPPGSAATEPDVTTEPVWEYLIRRWRLRRGR